MTDIISIGDATEDVFLQLIDAKVHCDIGSGSCQLCMNYADKIPVSKVSKLIGGNASNLAIGMRRLGKKSAYYCELGKDDQGKKILNALKENKVDTKYVQLKKGTSTNYSVVLNLGAERTILIYHVERKYQLPKFENADWLYYTSMGKGFEIIHKDILAYLKKTNAKFGFNPGTHQMKAGAKVMGPFYRHSEVCLVNKEEAQLITKNRTDNIKKLLQAMKNLGSKIAVITDGPKGSYAYDGKRYLFQDIFDVPVIERTGCGDSYSTGFIAALMNGLDMDEAMRWGTLNAAYVIQHIGPQAGLMKLAELKKILKKHPEFHPVPLPP